MPKKAWSEILSVHESTIILLIKKYITNACVGGFILTLKLLTISQSGVRNIRNNREMCRNNRKSLVGIAQKNDG